MESGREWLKERPENEQASIVFAAILLGDRTLSLFTDALQDPEIKKRGSVEDELKRLLIHELGLDEIFASWLSCNLHRLNKESVKFLETLEPDTYYFVRTSTVAQFNFETQLKHFKSRARTIFKGFRDEKRTMLEAAMTMTNDKGVLLDMDGLNKVCLTALKFPKMSKVQRDVYKELPLDKWADEASKAKQQAFIEDKKDLRAAFFSIAERHTDLNGKYG